VSTVHLESDWLTLDNAAKIYPTASSKLSPTVFRLSAMLRAPVRLSALQQASDALVRRCPYFQVYLKRGLFWYYLQRHRDTPRVQLLDRSSLESLPDGGKTEHLLRIRARGRTIAVDFSHILTDGAGGLRFFRSLLAEYLRLCGVDVDGRGDLLDPRERPDPGEAEDGHRKYFDKGGPGPTRYAAAYHIPDRPLQPGYFRTLTGRLPASRMLSLSRAEGCYHHGVPCSTVHVLPGPALRGRGSVRKHTGSLYLAPRGAGEHAQVLPLSDNAQLLPIRVPGS